MVWQIKLSNTARKQFAKLDPSVAKRLAKFLRERIAPLDDPRSVGKALLGSVLSSYWRYRIGDYRLVCEIQDGKLCILVVEVGDRKEIYR